ncbi:MAG: CD225/dispanin family protein [Bacteroides sp.]|nr:CD225/dispanin family protein [Bacteroides sp.]
MTEVPAQKPNNYLVWSILTTLFCCLPTGIVAIVYASRVDSAWYGGRIEEALNAAKNARTWTFVSVGLGVLGGIISFCFGLFSALLGI